MDKKILMTLANCKVDLDEAQKAAPSRERALALTKVEEAMFWLSSHVISN